MRMIALIGDPVAQSPSPAMHRAAFAATRLEVDYVAERIAADELGAAFERLRTVYAGLNVTRPHKETIVPLLDQVRGTAAETGSVNTVTMMNGEAIGDSTDGAGFLAALDRSGAPSPERALILGAGGSARAVVAALRSRGTTVTVAARNPAKARGLPASAIALEAEPVREALHAADLLVNATPLGDRLPILDWVRLPRGLIVFDLVYAPRSTALLAAARDAGCRTVEGIEMLVEQGAHSFEIWTGIPAPTGVMREAALASLEARAAV
jgi:shikimate dehydrogenase